MKLSCSLPVQNICNFYVVTYRSKITGKIVKVKAYRYDIYGDVSYSSGDIELHKYECDSEIINGIDLIGEIR